MTRTNEVRKRLASYRADCAAIIKQIDELVERKRLIQLAISATEDDLLFTIHQDEEQHDAG